MLSWDTINKLPRLYSYEDALKRYHETKPVRGCDRKLRPIGRRNQKWFNINLNPVNGDIGIGYGELWLKRERNGVVTIEQPLIIYHKDNTVSIGAESSWIGASCRERIAAITGIHIRREANLDWVLADFYVDGEQYTRSWAQLFPIQKSKRGESVKHVPKFILTGNWSGAPAYPTYINPLPSYNYTINRAAKKEIISKYRPFIDYTKNIAKLMGNNMLPACSGEELMKLLDIDIRQNLDLEPNYFSQQSLPPEVRRKRVLDLASTGNTDDMYLAMLWVSFQTLPYWERESRTACSALSWRVMWDKIVMHAYKHQILESNKVYGRIVRNPYVKYMLKD